MLINPKLPSHFFDRDNGLRSEAEINKFWNVPIILTEEYSENDTWADYQDRTAGNTADYVRGVTIFAKAFMSVPAQQAAKITRPLMPAAAPAVLVTRSLPNKG